LGLIEDIVISIVVFLVVSLRNTAGTVFQGANSLGNTLVTEKVDFLTLKNIALTLAIKNDRIRESN